MNKCRGNKIVRYGPHALGKCKTTLVAMLKMLVTKGLLLHEIMYLVIFLEFSEFGKVFSGYALFCVHIGVCGNRWGMAG